MSEKIEKGDVDPVSNSVQWEGRARVSLTMDNNIAKVSVALAPGIIATVPFELFGNQWKATTTEGVDLMLSELVNRVSKKMKENKKGNKS